MNTESILSVFSIVGFISTIASLILAIVAIWLSIVFFKMSSDLSKNTTEAAKGIGASVDRLEKLFDKLYADTFSMMKDTVSDMRKHIWPDGSETEENLSEEVEKKAEEKVSELKNEMDNELSTLLKRQKVTDHNLHSLRSEIQELLNKAIVSSRNVEIEAREETLRDHLIKVLRTFRRRRRLIKAVDLVERLPFPPHRIITELQNLKDEGLVEFESSDGKIEPETKIHVSSKLLHTTEK